MAGTVFDSVDGKREAEQVIQALDQVRQAAMVIRSASINVAAIRAKWTVADSKTGAAPDVAELDARVAPAQKLIDAAVDFLKP
jgi:hypothetical protein